MKFEDRVIYPTVEIYLCDLVEHVAQEEDYEVIIEFIRQIDLAIADWDFTELLVKFARGLRHEMDTLDNEER